MTSSTTQEGLRHRRVDSVDRRVVKTRARLVDAYLALLAEDPDAAAKASVVAERAGVTRSSFYAHFADVDHLAVAALAGVNGDLVASARRDVADGGSKTSVNGQVVLDLARFVDANRATYGRVLARGGEFADALIDHLADEVLATLHTRAAVVADPEVTARYVAGGTVAVLRWWLDSGTDRTAEDLAAALIAITPPDLRD